MNYTVLKIYASNTDKIGNELLYEHIVYSAKASGISGVTVYRGIMGFGMSSKTVTSTRFWELTEKLPVVIEVIDTAEKIEKFYSLLEPDLQEMPKGCLVTAEPVEVLMQKKGS